MGYMRCTSILCLLALQACAGPATDSTHRDIFIQPAPAPFDGQVYKISDANTAYFDSISGPHIPKMRVWWFQQRVKQDVLGMDFGDDGRSTADQKHAESLSHSNRIFGEVAKLFGYDTDRNGIIDRSEIKIALGIAKRKNDFHAIVNDEEKYEYQSYLFREIDKNGDGNIEIKEAYDISFKIRYIDRKNEAFRGRAGLWDMDFNGDKIVVEAEVDAALKQYIPSALQRGLLRPDDPAEIPDDPTHPRAARLMQLAELRPGDAFAYRMRDTMADPKCEQPKSDYDAITIDVLIYEGAQVSSVTVADDDALTTTSEINIEPGEKPLILRLGADRPHIWRLKGSTDRIRHIALISQSPTGGLPLAGVTGFPGTKIEYQSDVCFVDETKIIWMKKHPKKIYWHDGLTTGSSGTIYQHQVAGLSLPSADRYDYVVARPEKFKGEEYPIRQAWLRYLRSYPRGVYEFSESEYQEIPDAKEYTQYPKQLGVIRLLKEGILSMRANGDYVMHKPLKIPPDIDFPDALIVQDGVAPQPWFKTARICIVDEKGKQLSQPC